MKIILKETISALGIIGTEANVADGYARNYLLPRGMAVLDTPQNRKQMQQEKSKIDLQIAKEKKTAEEMAQKLEGVRCTIAARVSEEDRLYGSISAREIVNALAEQGITVEKRMILLPSTLKAIGTYPVPIRIYGGIEPEILVEIVAEEP